MTKSFIFTVEERHEAYALVRSLSRVMSPSLSKDEKRHIIRRLNEAYANDELQRDAFGLNPIVKSLQTALLGTEQIGLGKDAIIATLLYCSYNNELFDKEAVKARVQERQKKAREAAAAAANEIKKEENNG